VPFDQLPALRNVHFAFDRCELGPESRRIVTAIAELLRAHPEMHVRIEGHTDVRGTSAYNLGLSACRICAVRSLLESQGVLPSQMTADPRGKKDPFTPQRSRRAHALNRRVELVLVDAQGREIPASPQERDLQIERGRPAGYRGHRPEAADFPSSRGTGCSVP
jgi:outer membrane protein OmpA-like peptidoglycan-associated protein